MSNPTTLNLVIDGDGDSEVKPYTWDFANLLADLGDDVTLTGTPDIDVSPNDGYLTIGSAVLNDTDTAVQAIISANNVLAAQTGLYKFSCRSSCTDGSVLVCRGYLSVTIWR